MATSKIRLSPSGALIELSSNVASLNVISDLTSIDVADITENDIYVVKGYNTPDDNGGGVFVVIASGDSPNEGTVFEPANVGTSTLRFHRQTNGKDYSVLWWGADNTGVTRADDRIQLAFDSFPGHRFFVPFGIYRLEDTLRIHDGRGGNNWAGHTVIGETSHNSNNGRTQGAFFEWFGPADRAAIENRARDCILETFDIAPGFGQTLLSGIDYDHSTEAAANLNTAGEINNVGINGAGGSGTLLNGFRLGARDPLQANLENLKGDRFVIRGFEDTGFAMLTTTGQAKGLSFNRLELSTSGIAGTTGVLLTTGSLHLTQPRLNALGLAFNYISPSDYNSINGIDSENCERFLEWGTASNSSPLLIDGGRIAINQLDNNFSFMNFNGIGPMSMRGVNFSGNPPSGDLRDFKIGIGGSAAGNFRRFIDCGFPTTEPFTTAFNIPRSIIVENCVARRPTSYANLGTAPGPSINVIDGFNFEWPRMVQTHAVGFDIAADRSLVAASGIENIVQRWRDKAGICEVAPTVGIFPERLNVTLTGSPQCVLNGTTHDMIITPDDHTLLDVDVGSFLVLGVVRFPVLNTDIAVYAKSDNTLANHIRCIKNAANNLQLIWGSDVQTYAPSANIVPANSDIVVGWGIDALNSQVIYITGNGFTIERQAVVVSGTGSNTVPAQIGQDTAGAMRGELGVTQLYFCKGQDIVQNDLAILQLVQDLKSRFTLI